MRINFLRFKPGKQQNEVVLLFEKKKETFIFRHLLLAVIFLGGWGAHAQIVNISDPVFKAYLLENDAINTNQDGEIQMSEAITYTGGINVSNLGITNLYGIGAFANITSLLCNSNYLNVLDVSSNTSLTELNCSSNNLESLNLQNGNNSNLTSFNCTGNSALGCIQVDDVIYMQNNWASAKDVSAIYSLVSQCCPDAYFDGEFVIAVECDEMNEWGSPPILGVYIFDSCFDHDVYIVTDEIVSTGGCMYGVIRTFSTPISAATFTQIVYIEDTTPPIFTEIPTVITTTLPQGQSTANVSYVVAGTDNCSSSVSMSLSHPSGSAFGLGATTVYATLTDECGNIAYGSFSVLVTNAPPPSNNNPAPNNPSLNTVSFVYPNCYLIQGTTAGATPSVETGQRDVWYQFNALTNGISIKVGSSIVDAKIFLFRSDNLSVILDEENLVNGVGAEVLNFGGLIPGMSYRIAVASMGSSDGAFNLCIQQLRRPSCGAAPAGGVYNLCSAFKSNNIGAANTLYSFTQGGTTASIATAAASVPLGHPLLQLQYGNSYSVGLTANYVLQNGLGQNETIQVSNVGACTVNIVNHPLMEVKSNQRCTNGATLYRSSYLQASPIGTGNICGVTGFKVEFTPVSNCTGDNPVNIETFSKGVLSTTPSISLSYAFNQIPLVGNTAIGRWSVRWAPMFGSVVGTYGPAHVISVNGTAAPAMAAHNADADAVAHTSLNNQISATMYPNPNNGDLVNLNMTGITTPDVFVRIMDAMGREVYTNRFTVDGSLNTVVNFSKPLASGLYMVEFRSGNDVITQRMMVNK